MDWKWAKLAKSAKLWSLLRPYTLASAWGDTELKGGWRAVPAPGGGLARAEAHDFFAKTFRDFFAKVVCEFFAKKQA